MIGDHHGRTRRPVTTRAWPATPGQPRLARPTFRGNPTPPRPRDLSVPPAVSMPIVWWPCLPWARLLPISGWGGGARGKQRSHGGSAFRPRWTEADPTVMGSRELRDQDANPCGPTILTTTVAMLLEVCGSGVGSGGCELTKAFTAALLGVPFGKQQTCSTRVAVTVAPGGRSSPGSVQAAGSLQVREMGFSWSGVPMLSTVATAVSGPRLVAVMAKLANSPTFALGAPSPIHRMATARSALAAVCARAVASGTAAIGTGATTTATPARPSLRAARPAPMPGRCDYPTPRSLLVPPSTDLSQLI